MNANTKILTLMAALAVGSAAAQATPNTTSTAAGTPITNQASATFDNPSYDPGKPTDPASNPRTNTVPSNTVTTTVLPLPGFDIVYSDGTPDGNTLATTPKAVTGAKPGRVESTEYALVNNGNTALTVLLRPNVTGGASTAAEVKYLDASGVELPRNSDGNFVLTLPAGTSGVVKFTQQLTIPADAPANATYGASPEGFVTGTGLASGQNGIPSGSTLYENQTVQSGAVEATPGQAADLQFVRVTTFLPTLQGSPNVANPVNPVGPGGTTGPTAPPLVTVNVPTVPGGTPNQPAPTQTATGYPSTPSNPADPSGANGTPIVPDVQGNKQVAYPKADNDNPSTNPAVGQTNDLAGGADTVIFTNQLKNNGASDDTVQLFPAGGDKGLLDGTIFDANTGVFTLPDGTKVRFLAPGTGQPIPVAAGALYPTVTAPAGKTVIYRTEVTLPDGSDAARVDPLTIVVGADSLNDAGAFSDTNTFNEVRQGAAQFGDSTDGLGAVPTPAPQQRVMPSSNTSTNTSTTDDTDNVAVFPMDVANMGAYNDSYTLSATAAGLPAGTTVTYVDGSGAALPTNGAGNFVTPVVAAGQEIKVYAVITVPTGTAAGLYTVSQKAVGNYSTVTMTDLNDVIKVGAVGAVSVAKFVQDGKAAAGATPQNGINNPANYTANNTAALPGANIVYQIIGKNSYNAPVARFALNDTVPANTTFQSASLSVNGTAVTKVIYKIGTGTWSASAPAAGAAAGTVIAVAADADSDGDPDALPSGATMELTFTVKVN